MSRIHTHPVCQNCISFCHIKNSCREQSSEFFGGSAAAYAWFVWEKGYKGETTVKWFN